MKKLTAVAFLAVMIVGATSANANMMLRREGVQNFYYYFGGPCPCKMAVEPSCGPVCEAPCAAPNPCCDNGGMFDGMFFGIL